jgi:hypothetical protein
VHDCKRTFSEAKSTAAFLQQITREKIKQPNYKPIAPAYTVSLACLIARTAAIKNVLSPNSVAKIKNNEFIVALKNVFVTETAAITDSTATGDVTPSMTSIMYEL